MDFILLFYYFIIFIFGLIIGSFLNCYMYRRLPAESQRHSGGPASISLSASLGGEQEKSLKGRSFCPHCKHKLSWLDLFPVFSFLFLRGKCRYCRKKISWQYPIVELMTGLLFLLIFNYQLSIFNKLSIINFQNLINLAFLFYIFSSLIIIFVYDLKHYLIPDKVLFPAIIIAATYKFLVNLSFSHWNLIENLKLKIENSASILNFILAVFIASGFFFIIWLVSGGKWMGFGDVKLAILLGLVLGFPNILTGLFLAFLFGAIIGVVLMALKKKELNSKIPFGPFLIAGTFMAILWGQQLMQWYLNLLLL